MYDGGLAPEGMMYLGSNPSFTACIPTFLGLQLGSVSAPPTLLQLLSILYKAKDSITEHMATYIECHMKQMYVRSTRT